MAHGEKHEHIVEPRCFYALSTSPNPPPTFVVPSSVVADVLSIAHRAWLATAGRGGRAHVDHTMRRILPSYSFEVAGYAPGWLDRDRWDLLGTAITSNPDRADLGSPGRRSEIHPRPTRRS